MDFAMYSNFCNFVRRDGWEKAAADAADMGFSGVEILEFALPGQKPLFADITEAVQAREILKKHALSVVCYSVFANVYQYSGTVELLKRHAEMANALGSPYLHHTLLPWMSLTPELPSLREGLDFAVKAAAEVAKHATKHGVTCIYEEQGLYINGVENFGLFYDALKKECDNVGVCADMGNSLFIDEPAEDLFAAFAGEIRHVHAKDYLFKDTPDCPGLYWSRTMHGNWLRDTMLGNGVVDVEACMKVLRDISYRGPISLELGHPEPFVKGVEQAMQYLNRFPLT